MIVFSPTVEQANDLIFRLYQAAQDHSHLPSFMTELGNRFGSHIVGLRIHDSACDAFCSHYIESIGISVSEWQAFDRNVGERNFWRTRGVAHLDALGVGHDRMIASRRELVRTSFYEDLRAIGIEAGMGIRIWKGKSGQSAVLSLNRPSGATAYDSQEVAFVQHLLPHFRNAYGIMRRLSWIDATSSSIAAAVDRLHIGVLLLTSEGTSVYRNEAASRTLDEQNGLRLSPAGKLRCASVLAQHSLDMAVNDAAHGRLPAPRRIPNRDIHGNLRAVLVVTMLRGELIPWHGSDEPCAMLFVHRASPSPEGVETSHLQELLKLTSAETRLATLMATGHEPAACADLLGVSITTVRTQLRSLFRKTDTCRQPELVALLTLLLRLA